MRTGDAGLERAGTRLCAVCLRQTRYAPARAVDGTCRYGTDTTHSRDSSPRSLGKRRTASVRSLRTRHANGTRPRYRADVGPGAFRLTTERVHRMPGYMQRGSTWAKELDAMMGNGGGSGFNFGNMMNGVWSGGWPMLLLGVLVVTGIVLLVIWAVRGASKK